MSWHKIESALVNTAIAYGYNVDQSEAGDRIAIAMLVDPQDDTIEDANLTELAKDLAKELRL